MARQRVRYWANRKKGVFVGRFHEIVVGKIKKNPPLAVLCSIEEASYKIDGGVKRQRSEQELIEFLDFRYNEILLRIHKTTITASSNQTSVQEVLDLWLKEIARYRSIRTLADYQLSAKIYLSVVGNHPINLTTPVHGIKLMDYFRSKSITDRTIYKHMGNLQSFFNWALRQELTNRQVQLPRPLKTKKEPRIYSKEQLAEVEGLLQSQLQTASNQLLKLQRLNQLRAFRLAVFTAMRGGEIWSLKLENIRLKEGVILIRDAPEIGFRVKGKREDRIPIAEGLIDFLLEDLSLRGPRERWFIDDGSGGQGYKTEAVLAKAIGRINGRLGIHGVKPLHGIRATVITHLLEGGAELTLVQKLARHTLITTTKGYQNTDRQNCRPLVDSIQLLPIKKKIIGNN